MKPLTCKWQVTKGADCKWFDTPDTSGVCSGAWWADPECEGVKDVAACLAIGKCNYKTTQVVTIGEVTLSYSKPPTIWGADVDGTAKAVGAGRRLQEPTDVVFTPDIGIQLALKQGIAAGFCNVEAFEVAVDDKIVYSDDIVGYNYKIVGSSEPQTCNQSFQQRQKVTNDALLDYSKDFEFNYAKFKTPAMKSTTRTFNLTSGPAPPTPAPPASAPANTPASSGSTSGNAANATGTTGTTGEAAESISGSWKAGLGSTALVITALQFW